MRSYDSVAFKLNKCIKIVMNSLLWGGAETDDFCIAVDNL